MKKHPHIRLHPLLLLLIYLFSTSPTVLFHHHESNIVAFQQANTCEKAIYYGHHSQCDHDTHLSKAAEKCGLCDNHTVSAHISQTFSLRFAGNEYSNYFSTLSFGYFFKTPSACANRGPPMI